MKTLILGILLIEFALDAVVERLNWKALPQDEAFRRQRSYFRENLRLRWLEHACELAFWILLIQSNLPAVLEQQTQMISEHALFQGTLWLFMISALRSLIGVPFQAYATFSIEARYGFNQTTLRTFLGDRVKGILLSLILGLPAFMGILFLFEKMGVQAWWMTWLAATLLSLGLGYLAPSLILPLFNRFEPLANGELRNAIEDYARKEQFPIQGTFVMDGSKRSTKRNAFFTGFGRLRRLVLFDTLLQNHTHSEILAIVAHEMGHFKLGHIPKSIAISILTQGALFWTIGRFLASPLAVAGVQETLGLQEITTAGSLLVIALLYSPISRVLSVGMLAFSRKNEFEADAYSRRTFGDAEALISALQKMEKDHLSHPSPHPLKVILEYSHPPVEKRAQALRCQTLGESQDFSVLK